MCVDGQSYAMRSYPDLVNKEVPPDQTPNTCAVATKHFHTDIYQYICTFLKLVSTTPLVSYEWEKRVQMCSGDWTTLRELTCQEKSLSVLASIHIHYFMDDNI